MTSDFIPSQNAFGRLIIDSQKSACLDHFKASRTLDKGNQSQLLINGDHFEISLLFYENFEKLHQIFSWLDLAGRLEKARR
jgi:hypothetical protein